MLVQANGLPLNLISDTQVEQVTTLLSAASATFLASPTTIIPAGRQKTFCVFQGEQASIKQLLCMGHCQFLSVQAPMCFNVSMAKLLRLPVPLAPAGAGEV